MGGVHIELDALYHGPDWTPIPSFRADLARAIEAESWVADGNYGSSAGAQLWAAADTVVWLDYPRRVVFPSLVSRTLRRGLTGETLWNGNREHLSSLLSLKQDDNLLMWAWNHYGGYRQQYGEAMMSSEYSHLRFIRLRTRAEAETLVRSFDGLTM